MHQIEFHSTPCTICISREFKYDVYGRRQTAKVNSDVLFFCCNPYINHTKIKKCLLVCTANTKTLIPLYSELKKDGKSFVLPFAENVMHKVVLRPKNNSYFSLDFKTMFTKH